AAVLADGVLTAPVGPDAACVADAPTVVLPTTGSLRNRKCCCPSVQTLVVTQYRTRPNCQYRPVSAKNGAMYIMFFDIAWAAAAPGWSGSGAVWFIMPRRWLCRIVMNVVPALTSTNTTMRSRDVNVSPAAEGRNWSYSD